MGIKQLYNDNLLKLLNEYGNVSIMNLLMKSNQVASQYVDLINQFINKNNEPLMISMAQWALISSGIFWLFKAFISNQRMKSILFFFFVVFFCHRRLELDHYLTAGCLLCVHFMGSKPEVVIHCHCARQIIIVT